MKFQIRNRKTITEFKSDQKYIVISITCIREKHPELPKDENLVDYLKLNFYDADDDAPGNFTNHHARQILNFVKKYENKVKLIVCQCDAGIARSSGTALALSDIYNIDKREDRFDPFLYVPNKLVYKTIMKVHNGNPYE